MILSSAFTLFTPRASPNGARILLQYRSADAPRYPLHWGFFGGGVEAGETHLQAVLREAEEELGLVLHDPVDLGTFDVEERKVFRQFRRTQLYALPWEHDLEQLRRQQREGIQLDLFPLREALSDVRLVPTDRVLVEKLDRWIP